MEQALGTAETVLLYLEHGMAGKELDKIAERPGESIGKRYRDMVRHMQQLFTLRTAIERVGCSCLWVFGRFFCIHYEFISMIIK